MSTLDFAVLDLDFPAGSKNKTATLVTGHRLPGTPADASAIAGTREYLVAFAEELAEAAGGAALTAALTARCPGHGMLIAAQIGARVATGEMSWG